MMSASFPRMETGNDRPRGRRLCSRFHCVLLAIFEIARRVLSGIFADIEADAASVACPLPKDSPAYGSFQQRLSRIAMDGCYGQCTIVSFWMDRLTRLRIEKC